MTTIRKFNPIFDNLDTVINHGVTAHNNTGMRYEALFCGYCHKPAFRHNDQYRDNCESWDAPCDRSTNDWSIAFDYDYYVTRAYRTPTGEVTHDIVVATDYSGMMTNGYDGPEMVTFPNTKHTEDCYCGCGSTVAYYDFPDDGYTVDPYLAEYNFGDDDTWFDKDPNVCTSITKNYKSYYPEYDLPDNFIVATDYSEPATRNAYVEGFDGFLTQQFIDYRVTALYQARLLNVYVHKKTNNLMCGSVAITSNSCTDNSTNVTLTCVSPSCKKRENNFTGVLMTFNTNVDRNFMETITTAVIRHGNNHGPSWLTSRSDYYKVHTSSCDLDCGKNTEPCNKNSGHESVITDPESLTNDSVLFLCEHQKHCTDNNCTCQTWLNLLFRATTKELQALHLDNA